MENKDYQKLKNIENSTWKISAYKKTDGEFYYNVYDKTKKGMPLISAPTKDVRKLGNFYHLLKTELDSLSDTYKNTYTKEYKDLQALLGQVEGIWRDSTGREVVDVARLVQQQATLSTVMEAYGVDVTFKKDASGKDIPSKGQAPCPFHNDHDPSLSVDDEHGMWHCWVCKSDDGQKDRGGNIIEFVRQMEVDVLGNRLFTKKDAINKVIDICGLDAKLKQISDEERMQYVHNRKKYDDGQVAMIQTMKTIDNMATYTLQNGNDGVQDGLNYLLSRNMDKSLIEKMGFGWFPKKRVEAIIQNNSHQLPLEMLEKVGFIQKDYNGNYRPTYNDRVLIPICDERGNVVTFSGRSIDGEEPKYRLGRNTEIFKKDNLLYHYHIAKNSAYERTIYVVEGFMEVAAGEKIGVPNMVATMGCSLSDTQMEMLKRLKAEIFLCRDNDKAGKEAMIREVPKLLKEGMAVSVVDLARLEVNDKFKNQDGPKKDLWDFAALNVTKEDLQSCVVHGLDYLFEKKYFNDRSFSADSVYTAFLQAQHDGILKNEKDKEMFVQYVQKNAVESVKGEMQPIYSSESIRDILQKKELEEHSVMFPLYQKLLSDSLQKGTEEIVRRVLNYSGLKATQGEKERVCSMFLKTFFASPENHLKANLQEINYSSLLTSNVKGIEQVLTKNDKERNALLLAVSLCSYQSQSNKNLTNEKVYSYLKKEKQIHENLIRYYLHEQKIVQYSNEKNEYYFALLQKDENGLLTGISSYDMTREKNVSVEKWGNEITPIVCGYDKKLPNKMTLVFPNLIEVLSYQTLLNRQGKDINAYVYVSTEGKSLYDSMKIYCQNIEASRVVLKYKEVEFSSSIEEDLIHLKNDFPKIRFDNELSRAPIGKTYSSMLIDFEKKRMEKENSIER